MPRICRVLVVEDNGEVRDLLGEVFAHEGYRFALAENGAGMRRTLAKGGVDVVVIDVLLRGENGIDLAQEALDAGAAVVLTTGDHSWRERIEEAGHRHILKPYRLNDLIEIVEAALDAAQARCQTKRRQFGTDQLPA